MILFNTARHLEANDLKSQTDDERITKAKVYGLFTRNGVYSVFNTVDRESHRSKHKVFAESSRSRQPVDMTTQTSHLTNDVVGKLTLVGYDLDRQTSDENRFFPRALLVLILADNLSNVDAKTRESAIWKAAMVFLAAGGNRAATGMTLIFSYLSRKPMCSERLAAEAVFTYERVSTGPSARRRLSRPICGANRRRKPSRCSWDGHLTHRGTSFGVDVYALGHNASIFLEPFELKPKRLLDATEGAKGVSSAKKLINEAFASFSIGPLNYVRKPFAYLDMSIIVANTLRYFDFERAPGLLGMVGGAA
ncbi:cytochrome P450 [Xylariaceae sp. FL0255]|nr:cytochrome P450 [Xylariaceae sp. FL0255]